MKISKMGQSKQAVQAAIAVAFLALAGAARADGLTPPDTSSIATFILACVAAVAAIGVATLSVKATVACYSWVRAAIK